MRISLDPASGESLFLQVAHALMRDIHRGRLKPGDPLPGYRSLAESLALNRNTILSAYQELLAEGWILSRPSEGTFVADTPPRHLPFEDTGPVRVADALGFDLRGAAVEAAGVQEPALSLGTGVPDLRHLPTAFLGRAYARALRMPATLRAGDPQGHRRLREALTPMLASLRGLQADPSRLLVTRGSQMGLYLVAQTLLQPGDRVGVEALGSPRAWEALAQPGVKLVPLEVDAEGLRLESLQAALAEGPLRAVFTTPACQYPTMVPLAAARRRRLLGMALQHRFAIIEHDYDAQLHYEGPPILPLVAQDQGGVVVYVGTLSKLFAPGLRLGVIAAPEPLLARLSARRAVLDQHGDPALELAIAELIVDGELPRHVNRMETLYRRRRDALVTALEKTFGAMLELTPPAQGSALWIRAPGMDVDAWHLQAREAGVGFQPGRTFTFDESPLDCFRMGFTGHDEGELGEAVRRMARALELPSHGSKASGPRAGRG
ncbi:MAG TPA: PLP-dependent aminotransferase family protein [Geothrix sp.]|nr:PLP-dependent aminotransferase family protein [Geothrix sp.]